MRSAWFKTLTRLLADDAGQTMAEYGLVAAVLGSVMIFAVAMMQTESGQILTGSASGLVNVAQNPP